MNTPDNENAENNIISPLIRREAGEGWHPSGLNETLLGALAAREIIIDSIASQGGHNAPEELHQQYAALVERIAELKEQFGIQEPPAQMPPDTSGATE